jgi:hypothetical protein
VVLDPLPCGLSIWIRNIAAQDRDWHKAFDLRQGSKVSNQPSDIQINTIQPRRKGAKEEEEKEEEDEDEDCEKIRRVGRSQNPTDIEKEESKTLHRHSKEEKESQRQEKWT